MQRREFLALLAGAAMAWPGAAWGQTSGRLRQIGVLMPTPENDPETTVLGQTLRRELQTLGWTGGRNLRMAYRYGAGDANRIRAYAAELVGLAPDVILAGGAPAVAPLLQLTTTIPIVFLSVSDPLGQHFVASLAHPGGNITGFTNFDPATGGKWLELLKEIAPRVGRVAVLYNPQSAPYTDAFLRSVDAAGLAHQVRSSAAPVHDDAEIEAALAKLGRDSDSGLIVPSDAFTYSRFDKIVALAAQYRVPAIYPFRVFTTSGGLMSYGIDLGVEMKQAAAYIDRILSGTSPAELPVQTPQKFELIINVKAAKGLELEVPPALLQRADEVLE